MTIPPRARTSLRLRATFALVGVIALASIVSAAGSCGTPTTITGPVSPDSAHLVYGVRTLVNGTPLAFTFEKVAGDSRCAEDVVCVWAGTLDVQVRVENIVAGSPQPMTQLLQFSTVDKRVQAAFGYRVEMIAERPRGRGQPPPPESYWIALRLTSLPD